MFTRSRKLTTYISDMKGIRRQAARAKIGRIVRRIGGHFDGVRQYRASTAMESAATSATPVHIHMPMV